MSPKRPPTRKSKTTVVEVFGGPKDVVQYITTDPRVVTVCPVCEKPYRPDDPTVLVDLVTSFPVTEGSRREASRSVRVHICQPCAAPIIRQKQEAIDRFLSMLAKMIADQALKEEMANRAYPPDDGPLSDAQLTAIRKQEPLGRMTRTSSLFGEAPRGKGRASRPKKRAAHRR